MLGVGDIKTNVAATRAEPVLSVALYFSA